MVALDATTVVLVDNGATVLTGRVLPVMSILHKMHLILNGWGNFQFKMTHLDF